MTELIESSSFFCISLTLIAFALASALHGRCRLALLNPILISAVGIMLVLQILDIPNSTYQAGCQMLSFLLTPATICFAISFYDQFQALKKHLAAITAGVLLGSVCSIGSVYFLCRAFGLSEALTISVLPKSVTTAIGVVLSQELGGISAVTTSVIVITGILGNMLGPSLIRLFRIKSPIAQGVAFGTASHVIGTSKAIEIHQLTGAVSSLALTLAGIITSVLLSFAAQFI